MFLAVFFIGYGYSVCIASDAQFNSAAEAFKNGNFETAASLFKEALESDSDNALGWSFYGQSLERTGDLSGARKAYERTLIISPSGKVADRTRRLLSNLNQIEENARATHAEEDAQRARALAATQASAQLAADQARIQACANAKDEFQAAASRFDQSDVGDSNSRDLGHAMRDAGRNVHTVCTWNGVEH